MSVTISPAPAGSQTGVINVGDEISTSQLAAIQNADNPTAGNPFAVTNSLLTKANTNLANTFDAPQLFNVTSSTSAALRVNASTTTSVSTSVGALYVSVLNSGTNGHAMVIENRGNGDCIRVHDQSAPDSSRFFVDSLGRVGILKSAIGAADTALEVGGRIICDSGIGALGAISANAFVETGTGTDGITISAGNITGVLSFAFDASYTVDTPTEAQTYDKELTFKVGNAIYKVPARLTV